MKKVIALALVFILCISLAGCLSSKVSLEEELSKYTWYREYKDSHGSHSLEVLEFHLNGKRESYKYYYSDGDWISAGSADNLSNSWEIMENNEIYFKGQYYEWGDDWELSGSTLIIGKYEYTNKPEKNYPD